MTYTGHCDDATGVLVEVSSADRIVFPELSKTKGDVVAYYQKIAPRLLPHLLDRPLSIYRFPKGLSAQGFFQKNLPKHYPDSMGRVEIPRSRDASRKHKKRNEDDPDVTVYPLLRELEHIPYVANQNAIELHVPTAKVSDQFRPDRIIIDLDPPPGAFAKVRRAAHLSREMMEEFGLKTIPVATGSKGYHVVAPIIPSIDPDTLGSALHKFGALLAAKYPDDLTMAFRIADRGERVFVDWLRNRQQATVIAPYSLRARPKATVAAPLTWEELDTTNPDAFNIDDADRLLERPDTVMDLAKNPADARSFLERVDEEFERSGLVLETFDRFRS